MMHNFVEQLTKCSMSLLFKASLLNTLAVSEYFSHALPRLGATIGHHCDRNFFPTKLSANLKQMLPRAKVRDKSGRE